MRIVLTLLLIATSLHAQQVVILADRALDGRGGVLRDVRINVVDGKITSLGGPAPSNATTIDLRGYTVLPGWIDTHVHLDSHFDRTGRIAAAHRAACRGRTRHREQRVALIDGRFHDGAVASARRPKRRCAT